VSWPQVHAITARPFVAQGDVVDWARVIVSFSDQRRLHHRVMVSASGRSSLGYANKLWKAIPDSARESIAPPRLDDWITPTNILGELWRAHDVHRQNRLLAAGRPASIKGMMHGPSIPRFIGISWIEITPDQLIEHEAVVGGGATWVIATADVRDVRIGASPPDGVEVPPGWHLTTFSVDEAPCSITYHPDYEQIVCAALSVSQTPGAPTSS